MNPWLTKKHLRRHRPDSRTTANWTAARVLDECAVHTPHASEDPAFRGATACWCSSAALSMPCNMPLDGRGDRRWISIPHRHQSGDVVLDGNDLYETASKLRPGWKESRKRAGFWSPGTASRRHQV